MPKREVEIAFEADVNEIGPGLWEAKWGAIDARGATFTEAYDALGERVRGMIQRLADDAETLPRLLAILHIAAHSDAPEDTGY